ncbi:MAG TPA: hypothetical protein VLW06_10075 [Terriglobales bacterium]|nr:hypothetical protein [Terriglobales bacterium]
MKGFRIPVCCAVGLVFLLFAVTPAADGELPWPLRKKREIEVRLIALAMQYPRSSFFANDEVFVAEQELSKDESRFIKLVYDFLPYQVPLSDSGMNYSLVHKVNAVRDTTCDESLWEMRRLMTKRREAEEPNSTWKYAAESPISDLDNRQARLRCYRTTSSDYEKALNEPTGEIPY